MRFCTHPAPMRVTSPLMTHVDTRTNKQFATVAIWAAICMDRKRKGQTNITVKNLFTPNLSWMLTLDFFFFLTKLLFWKTSFLQNRLNPPHEYTLFIGCWKFSADLRHPWKSWVKRPPSIKPNMNLDHGVWGMCSQICRKNSCVGWPSFRQPAFLDATNHQFIQAWVSYSSQPSTSRGH